MKRFLVSFMAVLLMLPVFLSAPAEASNSSKEQTINELSMEDVMALESYISVKKGLFKFDSSSATKDGHNKELVKMQKDYLSDLNKEIKNGKLKAERNLEIVSLDPVVEEESGGFSVMATCAGKTSAVTYHWWGISRYMNNCRAIQFAGDLATVAAGYGGAGVVAAAWFPGVSVAAGVVGAYAGIMSARVSANNYGKGIYIGVTYAGFFNVKPQY